jgi:hypothetical protein
MTLIHQPRNIREETERVSQLFERIIDTGSMDLVKDFYKYVEQQLSLIQNYTTEERDVIDDAYPDMLSSIKSGKYLEIIKGSLTSILFDSTEKLDETQVSIRMLRELSVLKLNQLKSLMDELR